MKTDYTSEGLTRERMVLNGNPEYSPFFESLAPRILHRFRPDGWGGMVDRLMALAVQAEASWEDHSDLSHYLVTLRRDFGRGALIPNSPLLRNASESAPHLFACFALNPEKRSFLETARTVHDGMGGVGYPLDWLSTRSQVDNFLRTVDTDTHAHQSGRPRPASNAATIDVEHPGLTGVLDLAGKMLTTNLNVGFSNSFMQRVKEDEPVAVGRLREVTNAIHYTGQPGIVFVDRIPRISLTTKTTFAANVCGEAPLAIDESALLASLNLTQYLVQTKHGYDLDKRSFRQGVSNAVRFLDGMHDLHTHPTNALAANSLATRKIGVGIMGFAHALALLDIRYGTSESMEFAATIGRLLMTAAREESEGLAEKRGPFPAWQDSLGTPRRNACLVAVAGTATISLLVNTSGGIEPILAPFREQRVIDTHLRVLDPIVSIFCERAGISLASAKEKLSDGNHLSEVLPKDLAWLLPTALEIDGQQHLLVQGTLQREIDGGITKTINCPFETSVDNIESWIKMGWEEQLLGFTVYRNGSRLDQPVKEVEA